MPLQSRTYYTLELDGSAKDIVGIEIGESFVRSFTTLPADDERPVIIATYPIAQTRNFPNIGIITIAFNKLMDTTSLQNSIFLRRGNNNIERLLWFSTFDNKTIVTLKPVEPLQPNNTVYIAVITTDAKDITDNSMRAQYNFNFYTSDKTYKTPTVIESFASGIGSWLQPTGSGSTIGVDPSKTIMAVENTIYYPFTENRSSMRLNYSFLPSSSTLIRQYLNSGTARSVRIPVDTSIRLQSYVFGDGSKNQVRFCIDGDTNLDAADGHEVSNWVTIDWYGWRLLEWNFNDPAENGSWLGNGIVEGQVARFDSYQITHGSADEENLEGTIYFDELRYVEFGSPDISVPDLLPENIPSEFSLEQNYPNPFNPSTNLHLNISEIAKVKLVVYDILGREVSVLKDEIMNPGIYKVTWDATGMPSGTYFAKLYSGKNISTIKMLLAK
jgi:hypothetical protein